MRTRCVTPAPPSVAERRERWARETAQISRDTRKFYGHHLVEHARHLEHREQLLQLHEQRNNAFDERNENMSGSTSHTSNYAETLTKLVLAMDIASDDIDVAAAMDAMRRAACKMSRDEWDEVRNESRDRLRNTVRQRPAITGDRANLTFDALYSDADRPRVCTMGLPERAQSSAPSQKDVESFYERFPEARDNPVRVL
jgi:hypothetical protein